MKALFLTSIRDEKNGTEGKVELRNVEMPQPKEDEIRVKVAYASICGSDAHIVAGDLGEFSNNTKNILPMQLGHELSGVIDKVGDYAKELGYSEGDRVVCNYARYCHSCEPCRSGNENLCENLRFDMYGMAEYACYHVSQIHKIPDELDLRTAVLVEPLTIAIDAVEKAKVGLGKSVAIMGGGGIGLMVAQLAKVSGVSKVTVFDLVEEKRELALKLGADAALNPLEEEDMKIVFEAVNNKGYDCVIETSGALSAAKTVLELLATDGDGVYMAMYGTNKKLDVDLHDDFYWKQKHLHGLIMGVDLFPKSIRMASRLPLDSIIQKEYSFNDCQKAFDDQLTGKFTKIIMKMDH